LCGLVLTGYLALVFSGYFTIKALALVGAGLAAFLAVADFAGRRWAWVPLAVVAVAFLTLLGAALVSDSLSFFLFFGAFLVLLAAALAAGEIRRSTRAPVQVAAGGLERFGYRLWKLAILVALGSLVLTAGLFFVLPRTAHAAFGRLLDERTRLPGLASEVRLGQIGRLLSRDTPAMHVRLVGAASAAQLKWRGAVLSLFDGQTWRASPEDSEQLTVAGGRIILASDDQRRRSGERITYEVQLEPLATDVLFLAGYPEVLWTAQPRLRRIPAGCLRLTSTPNERIHYGATSYLDPPNPGSPPGGEYLQLPPLDPRIEALARRITAYATSDETRAFALERRLLEDYAYTKELPDRESPDPLAEFLFERKKGHCEYFASALAVMLRTVGIPSRLVTGFQSGTLNPVSGWYVVRASDAHSWVEAWLPDRGWITYDPTPPAADRRRSLLAGLYSYLDAAGMFWQDWVVGYDLSRQVTLAARMQSSGRWLSSQWLDQGRLVLGKTWAGAASLGRTYGAQFILVACVGAAAWFLAPAAWRWRHERRRIRLVQRGRAELSDVSLLYRRLLKAIERSGYQKPAWYTPDEFLRTLPDSPVKGQVASFVRAYNSVRFGGQLGSAAALPPLLKGIQETLRASGFAGGARPAAESAGAEGGPAR